MTGGFWCFYLQNVATQYQPSTRAWRGETGNRVSVDENVPRSTPLPSRRVAGMDNRAHVHQLGGRFSFQVLVWTKPGGCSGSSPCYQNSPEPPSAHTGP